MTELDETQELWPTEHSRSLIDSLTEYLTTTFALSDPQAANSLGEFLKEPEQGMFKGPYVRLRFPFDAAPDALDARGRPRSLDFYPAPYPPYGHQAAAFQRLTTKSTGAEAFRRPEPTLVTTGTGSGKTEAFLFPILDHVLRAKREGITGIKALILYPMNALANDQAGRLKDLILEYPELPGVRAGLYTGQESGDRSAVSQDGLITNRYAMRNEPPDILLTNYKMLDQMLLRADDAPLWQASATSLQYLVLDEFHSYDGAQGTDVAMLLRRLGAALKAHWPRQLSIIPHGPTEADRDKPLGRITPVATSATLGGSVAPDEANPMLDFARTVFGVPFSAGAVVPETRLSVAGWLGPDTNDGPTPRTEAEILPRIKSANKLVRAAKNTEEHLSAVLDALFTDPVPTDDLEAVEAALKTHPWTTTLLQTAHQAVSLEQLRNSLIPVHTVDPNEADEFVSHLLAVFSHLRKHLGRNSVTVETHLWIRELSRIDSYLDHTSEYLWSDDGETLPPDATDDSRISLPATFCRHCGARGWGSMLTPDGLSVEIDGAKVREASLRKDPKFRAMMDAAAEADALDTQGEDITKVEGLRFFHTRLRAFVDDPMTPENQGDFEQGYIIAVRLHTGLDADDLSARQSCPVCDTPDAVRFVGSAIATLLSVAVTGLFGAEALDPAEKKALVFTDSVQDAAHRAGFIQSRSHTFTLRTVLRQALAHLADQGVSQPHLEQLVDAVLDLADSRDDTARFMLVPPDVVDHDSFGGYWDPQATPARRRASRATVRRRLLFDMQLEFGLQARFGRTLELTGTASVETDSAGIDDLAEIGTTAISRYSEQLGLEVEEAERIRHWVRGVLIRMRLQGGLSHPWLANYLAHEGRRWHLWGGRRRDQGMPAFPPGRSAPAFPHVGGERPKDSGLDALTSAEAWYSWWTRRALKVGREISGHLARLLFEELVEAGVLETAATKDAKSRIYTLPPHRVSVSLTPAEGLQDKQRVLQCNACLARTFGTVRVIAEMTGAPCLNRRCQGELLPVRFEWNNYYRTTLYGAERTSRVIAREHSSLLPDTVRLDYEDQFRSDDAGPDSPNVLVATPTLEMGIDIGSLSTVMLSSMPRSVASYVQRVGRAGRLSGNSLALAFVQGRGEHLPKLHDPLSIINGDVRPPATYLEADEILRRQFLAYCADILARTPGSRQPRNLAEALRETGPETYLGRIMTVVRSGGQDVVDGFLESFGSELSAAAGQRLRDWAAPGGDHEGDTPFETRLHTAARRYQEDLLEERSRRDKLIDEVLPALRDELEIAERTAAEDSKTLTDAQRALRTGQGTLRRTEAQITQMTTKNWWISGLERYGLLPNYTLIEDSVTLDARISWRDEASGEWQAQVHAFERSSATALRDFAPGSTFYAQGMALKVDAVELGHDRRELAHWQLCPDCGWINKNLTPLPGGESEPRRWHLVAECPRCASTAIGDTGQVLPVVELTKVSSEVHRDEALISDRADERLRASYEVRAAADIDPATVTSRWYVKDFAFGADLLPTVTLRWLNLGPRGHSAAKRVIAGQEVQAPLFKICPACGTRETNPWNNHPSDHRYWCAHRKSADKHIEQIALARELETQGVLLHLPAELVEDDYTIPTLKAAVMLGLHEGFGGTPEHLGVIEVPESTQLAQHGYSQMTLLLHDTVPGGTGYLAEFSDHQRVHKLLQAAWKVVSTCDCDSEDQGDQKRLACHRCLLPHADYHSYDRVSRSAAARILETLLEGGSDDADTFSQPWQITDVPPVIEGAAESTLERQFRDALRDRLEAEGVTVTESMRGGYLTLSFRLPGQSGGWVLTPQVRLDATQPDFLLESPGTVGIAIYTDGRHYHASAAHNRLADDAEKRHGLRAEGRYRPWGITHEDIAAFRSGAERPQGSQQLSWVNHQMVDGLRDQGTLDERLLRAARSSAMHLLWEWIHQPDEKTFGQFAHVMTLATLQPQHSRDLASWEPEQPVDDPHVEPAVLHYRLGLGARDTDRWWRRRLGSIDLLAAGSPGNPDQIRVLYSLDDTSEALLEPQFADQWREWLTFSNLLGFRPPERTLVLTRSSAATILAADYVAAQAAQPPSVTVTADLGHHPELPVQWQPLMEDPLLSEEERRLLAELATTGTALPEVGEEYDDGVIVDIAWPEHKLAVLMEDGGGARKNLEDAGWRVLVSPEPGDVFEELRR